MTAKTLRRYTNIDELVDFLQNNRIILRGPSRWEDKNDICLLSRFVIENRCKSVLIKCFSKAEETYLMWKAHQFDDGIRVCIEFDDTRLLEMIHSNDVRIGSVDYKTIEQFRTGVFQLSQLPFIKRYPYRGENEFRIIYLSREKRAFERAFPIGKNCITKVIINPWIKDDDFIIQKNMIKNIPGCRELKVIKSKVLSSPSWIETVDNLKIDA